MKKLALLVFVMYLFGIGPCEMKGLLRPGGNPPPQRKRIIDIFKPRESPPTPAAPVTTPEPKPTAAIMWDGSRQYIVRGRERCYWSASKGAWMKPKRGACAGGICGWEAIKPGE